MTLEMSSMTAFYIFNMIVGIIVTIIFIELFIWQFKQKVEDALDCAFITLCVVFGLFGIVIFVLNFLSLIGIGW